jgi:hypothetical protein
MTTLREAAQQALEALERLVIGTDYEEAVATETTITALRAALEQPEPPWEAQTEAEKLAYCAGWWAAMEAKAKERPEQEPVAWICTDDEMRHRDPRWGRIKWIDASSEDELAGNFLYTAPPRGEWQSLTEEEVMQMTRAECVDMRWPSTALNIARTVEAALKERNT